MPIPSAVSNVTFVGTRGPLNNLSSFLFIAVAELSIINGIPSVSHENGDSIGSAFDVNTLMYRHGYCCRIFLRRLPWWLNAFLSSDKIMLEQISLVQYRMNAINNEYKYTNSISASDRNDLTNPSGGSGSKFIKNRYGTARCKGSS